MFGILGDVRDVRDVRDVQDARGFWDDVGVTVILIDNNVTPILLLYTSI
jgi:hypothetical protein